MFRNPRNILRPLFHPTWPRLFGTVAHRSAPSPRSHVIFLENHSDPINGLVYARCLPHFQELGYKQFFDEDTSGRSLQEAIDHKHESIQLYKDLKKELERDQLDISSRSDVEKFVSKKLTLLGKDPKDKTILEAYMLHTWTLHIQCYAANVTLKEFYKNLSSYGMKYKAIDIPEIELDHTEDVITSARLTKKRDQHFAQQYLGSVIPTFGRLGLAHAEGMQQCILEQLPLPHASAQFKFFYIHSQPAISAGRYREQSMRSGSTSLPLGLTSLDAATTPLSQVIHTVILALQHNQSAVTPTPATTPIGGMKTTPISL